MKRFFPCFNLRMMHICMLQFCYSYANKTTQYPELATLGDQGVLTDDIVFFVFQKGSSWEQVEVPEEGEEGKS